MLRGVIRADFTILLILLYVSSTDSPSGLKPVAETSTVPENYPPLNASPTPTPFFFFSFLKMEGTTGFGVLLNFLWSCLHCDEQ